MKACPSVHPSFHTNCERGAFEGHFSLFWAYFGQFWGPLRPFQPFLVHFRQLWWFWAHFDTISVSFEVFWALFDPISVNFFGFWAHLNPISVSFEGFWGHLGPFSVIFDGLWANFGQVWGSGLSSTCSTKFASWVVTFLEYSWSIPIQQHQKNQIVDAFLHGKRWRS